ncbi:MAG TPA: hypothetical protein VGO34_14950 [Alphaproteobacteria bacterium]
MIAIAAVALATALAGGLWRRWLGGWPGPAQLFAASPLRPLFWDGLKPRRTVAMAAGALLTWSGWLALSWPWAAGLTAATLLLFAEGHRYDDWTIVLRYPVIGVVYPLARRIWRDAWNDGAFLDGYTAAAELALGALYFGGFTFIMLGQ